MVQRNSGWLHFGESLGGALERARGELYTLTLRVKFGGYCTDADRCQVDHRWCSYRSRP